MIYKIKGTILISELNWYIKTPIEKANGTPIILDIWKDHEDCRNCSTGTHLKQVEITIKTK